jgi:hypothetical protein
VSSSIDFGQAKAHVYAADRINAVRTYSANSVAAGASLYHIYESPGFSANSGPGDNSTWWFSHAEFGMSGFWERVTIAFRCFFSILFHGEIPNDIVEKRVKPAGPGPQVPVTARPSVFRATEADHGAPETFDRAVQMLALLQRDGRLIDFLAEDISPYPDAQLGTAVRTIHEACRKVLDHYVKMEPILESEENEPVTIQAGFDASAIKLLGNVTGAPPIRGVLRHRGWRAKQVNLPSLPQASGRLVIAPAEVEIP